MFILTIKLQFFGGTNRKIATIFRAPIATKNDCCSLRSFSEMFPKRIFFELNELIQRLFPSGNEFKEGNGYKVADFLQWNH